MMRQFRQGDVFLRAVEMIPPRARPVRAEGDRVVVARGELSGHAHAFAAAEATMYRQVRTGRVFLLIAEEDARLRHEQHDPIAVPAGPYEVLRQREYTPGAVSARPIAD
jgi:hypothetical protein